MKMIIYSIVILILTVQVQAQNLKTIGLDSVFIQSMAIDPKDPNIIYAGGGAQLYGVTKKPGLFKTTNGGITWDTLLYNMQIRDIKIDPKNPKTLYASSSGIIKSTDGGLTWKDISNGLNTRVYSYVKCIKIDPVNTSVLYVGVAGGDGGDAYKSSDEGKNWKKILDGSVTSIDINPLNPNTLYIVNGSLCKSIDGGASWKSKISLANDIYWAIHIDEKDTNKLFSSGYTSGVFKSTDGGKTWMSKNAGFKLSKSSYTFQTMLKNGNYYSYVINGDDVYESINDEDWKELNINDMVAGCILANNGKLYIGASGLHVYTVATTIINKDIIPSSFQLFPNYPNPFNPSTQIKYLVSENESLALIIYNMLGEAVITLADKIHQPGEYELTWNGKNEFQQNVSSGVYIAVLSSSSKKLIISMILIK